MKIPALHTLFATGLLLLILGSYHTVTENSFQFDDLTNIVDVPALHIDTLDIESLKNAAENSLLKIRIIPNISFAIDWWRGQGSPAAFLQTNLIIHCINSLLVLTLGIQVFRLRRVAAPLFPAFAVAAVWALHPIQIQTVSYAVQRMTSMAALFMLLSVISYIKGRQTDSHRQIWLMFSLLAFFLGAITKEVAWITPLIVWLAEFTLLRQGKPLLQNRQDRIIFSLPFLAIALVIVDIGTGTGPLAQHILPGYNHRDFSLGERLLTQPRVLALHLSQLLWPLPGRFSIEHDVALSTSLINPPSTLLALTGLIVWCMSGLWALLQRDHRLIGFLLLWPVAGLVIESSIVPLEMIFEHRMYLPSITLFMLVVMLLWQWISSARSRAVLLFLLCCLLSISTYMRLQDWRSEILLYESATRVAPANARAWSNLGSYYAMQQRFGDAKAAFSRAIELSSSYRAPLYGLGKYYLQVQHDPQTAISLLTRALTIPADRDHRFFRPFDVFLERGNAYYLLDRFPEAIQDYTRALDYRPDNALALNNRGTAYLKDKDYQYAIADFSRATELHPQDDQGFRNLGLAWLAAGDLDRALFSIRRAVQLNSNNKQNLLLLNTVLSQLGRSSEAKSLLEPVCNDGIGPACRNLSESALQQED